MFGLNANRVGTLSGAEGEHDAYPVSVEGDVEGEPFEGAGDRVLCTDPAGCAFHPVELPPDCPVCEDALPRWMQYDVPENAYWLDLDWPGSDTGLWAWGVWDGAGSAPGNCARKVASMTRLPDSDVGTLSLER
jgi:hypothetical protein